ncbi:helix-turn-helix domain-containing protein [Candidatus Poriferisodalis sp.]|uniref:helix-turn-helix domain-containing protein n=1 Tax=Candidatus Poriferisodalis sp. TaxID=3101277 RepID=UPI003B028FEF
MPDEPEEPDDNGGTSQVAYEDITWLSTLKAADRMGITTRTLYRFIDRGDLPAYRFGRVIRLRLSDVDEFIEQCRVEPGSLEHLYPEARPDDPDEDDE